MILKMVTSDEILNLKTQGNDFFKRNELDEALKCYSKALKLLKLWFHEPDNAKPALDTKQLTSILYSNRSAVHLKQKSYTEAEIDATKSLEINHTDPKALLRRCQARENLQNFAEAFKDAKLALHYDPNNTVLQQTLQKLATLIQEKQKEAISTENRLKNMFEICFNKSTNDIEKRVQAMNNLLVLARENAGAWLIIERKGIEQIMKLMQTEKDDELILSAYRTLDQIANDEQRAVKILEIVSVEKVVRLLNRSESKAVDAASILIQRCFNALASLNPKESKKPDEDKCEKNKVVMTSLIFELKRMLTDPSIGVCPRKASIDLLLKNLMHMDCGLPRGWSWRFVEDDGLERLLKVSCNIPEQFVLPVDHETRDHVAVCMARLYDDMVFDNRRALYREVVDKFLQELQDPKTMNDKKKIEIICCLTTLLLGPFEIGISLVTNNAITKMMFDMAASGDELQQMVAAEVIVQTASKRERCSAIIASGIPILKKLYDSSNDNIKARALVGMCKCASSSGTDVSLKPMAEGSTLKLAQACKKFLLSSTRDPDVKRWAAEGLSYLTLDADVKEFVVEDATLIRSLVDLAKRLGSICVFGVASIFVNLTNTYDRPEPEPELVKLAQFAKHHVPEDHPKDAKQFVAQRVALLVSEGATAACVALSTTQSAQCRELLARSLYAFSINKDLRGTIVQEGGAKLLLTLSISNTSEKGRCFAAHGLAKIGVTMDPSIAFPGQRCYEVVRPLVSLLNPDRTGLQNYEALMALTNLSSMSDSVRRRIFKEKALPLIEEYWFMSDHKQLRAAAAELLMNLLHCEEVFDFESAPGTDRLKLWLLYSAEEDDDRLCQASSAGLAILTRKTENCKRLIDEVAKWAEVFKTVITGDDLLVQHRGLIALANVMESGYDNAARIVQTDLIDYLVVISKLNEEKRKDAQIEATRAVQAAEKFQLIKPSDRELHERLHQVSTIPEEA